MPRGPVRAPWRPLLLVTAGIVALCLVRDAVAEDIADWPCEQPYLEKLTPQDLGDGLPVVPPAEDWRADAAASAVVKLAADPENPPARGVAEIESLGKSEATPDRRHRMSLVLWGLIDETNSLRAFLVEGIRNNVIKARVVAEVVAENDAALAALPAGGSEADAKKREEIAQARFWNARSLDEAEDGAELLCRRLAYLDRKTKTLAESVRAQLEAP